MTVHTGGRKGGEVRAEVLDQLGRPRTGPGGGAAPTVEETR
jgi:hypothetical protein